jgi:phage gp36-like protein
MSGHKYIDYTYLENALSKEKLIELTGGDPDAKTADMAKIDWAIRRASGYMDSYISVKVSCPVENPDDAFKGCCSDLTLYFLYRQKPIDSEDNSSITELHNMAVVWLKQIVSGEVIIGQAEIVSDIAHTSAERIFEADDLKIRRSV